MPLNQVVTGDNSKAARLESAEPAEQIPWVMHPTEQSGFLIKTEVRDSSVVGAGRARFVCEAVKKGTVVRATKLIDAKLGRPTPGTTLVSTCKEVLMDAMRFDDVEGLPTNNEQIVNFAGTPFNVDEDNQATFHWTPCNYFNHSGNPNVVIALPREEMGMVHVVALQDIAVGEELFQDYREFRLPPWFLSLCEDWALTSTQALGAKLDGMDGFQSQRAWGKFLRPTCAGNQTEQIPWVMDPLAQSGFLVSTEVRDSSVDGAGRARFVTEAVKKGTVVRATKLIDGKLGRPTPGTTLVCTCKEVLMDAMCFDDVEGLPTNNEQIVNFAGTPFNVEEGNETTFHWTPCNYFNHSGFPNVVIALPREDKGMVHVVALRDISAGEELFQDYREFRLPPWFLSLCDEWALTSTQALGTKLDGMEGFQSQRAWGKFLQPSCAGKQTEQIPWVMDPYAQSGFLVGTEVRDSSVEGAGRARFVTEAVKKGTVVRATKLMDAKLGRPTPGTTLVSTCKELLVDAMRFDDLEGLPTNNEQIVNFAGTPFNVEEDNETTFHWTPCNYFNHSGNPNVVIALPREDKDMVHVVALRDIAAGEELFQDYREFRLPPWFLSLCNEWALTSTQSLGAQLDGMDGFQSRRAIENDFFMGA